MVRHHGFVAHIQGIIAGLLRDDADTYANLVEAYRQHDDAAVADEVDRLHETINEAIRERTGTRIRERDKYYSAVYGALAATVKRPKASTSPKPPVASAPAASPPEPPKVLGPDERKAWVIARLGEEEALRQARDIQIATGSPSMLSAWASLYDRLKASENVFDDDKEATP